MRYSLYLNLNMLFTVKIIQKSGADHIIAEVFKYSFDIIFPCLLQLYTKLSTESIFPETWQQGIIVPIFKG
jgi:hypothetical protein